MSVAIIIIIVFLFFLIFRPCAVSYTTKSGRRYRARDLRTAEIIDIIRDISVHLSYQLNEQDKKLLQTRLQNTSFKELIYNDPNILGWNFDKGREIGLKLYDSKGKMYPETEIISTLFHELAHSLTQRNGHHHNWQIKDEYLQSFVPEYVNILILKTSQLDK
tara:strand:- start:751 stop:1236 length:486 start_codon:yes stop_codon:yes gene_type:complete